MASTFDLSADDLDVPTAPNSPLPGLQALDATSTSTCTLLPLVSSHRSQLIDNEGMNPASSWYIQSHKPRCAICFLDLKFPNKETEVRHINNCWNNRSLNKEQGARISQFVELEESCPETIDWQENHRDQKTTNLLPNIQSVKSSSPEDSAIDVPQISCIVCSVPLHCLDQIQAFQHHVTCISTYNPRSCPTCLARFISDGEDWDQEDVVLHLYSCAHGGNFDSSDIEKYDDLVAAWNGRNEMVWRLLERTIGERKKWSHKDHRESYKKKIQYGRSVHGNIYALATSSLRRAVQVVSYRRTEVTTWKQTNMPPNIPIEKFRRNSFSALSLPTWITIPSDFQLERELITTQTLTDNNMNPLESLR
ncbi:hypothetical protein BKA66DRAFT_437609 [Pyrenochaeta sp. MPI-SDFR-AT-0127]|nr:hypothetical protein BKA66DRAFT_437609 [Pyrenochaeta sp. MPI-SDFR-AT-0127]